MTAFVGGPLGPDFNALLGRGRCTTACLYAFDLLHVSRDDLRGLELVERRALLRKYSSYQGLTGRRRPSNLVLCLPRLGRLRRQAAHGRRKLGIRVADQLSHFQN